MELRRAAKARPRSERVMWLVHPLARPAIRALASRGVDPQHVVLVHGGLGLAAAAVLAAAPDAARWSVPVLLLAKVLLDNVDGGLARATGRVTLTGRYLDTLVDALGNLALFLALARYGPLAAALAGLAVLTVVLSTDYNLERMYRQARASTLEAADPPVGAPPRVYRWLRRAYELAFAPQDRLLEALDRWAFRIAHGRPYEDAPPDARLAWNDLFSTASVADLGLSTQLVALSLCVALGAPFAYVWLVLAQGAYLGCMWLVRIARARSRAPAP